MDRSDTILRFLQDAGIPYTLYCHEPKWTIEECLNTPGLDQCRATMCKNVFLCNRQQTAFYLMLLHPDRPFRTAEVSKLLGVSRLSFAPEEKLPPLLGLEKGAVSPLGLQFDRENRVSLVVDNALLRFEALWFHPGVNTQSLEMSAADFFGRYLTLVGHTYQALPLSPL